MGNSTREDDLSSSDRQYQCALSAALVILDELDRDSGLPKHRRLAIVTFSILHAMQAYAAEQPARLNGFSPN